MEAASLCKLPILVETARQLENGTLSDDKPLTFEEADRVEGSGVLKERPAGGKYTPSQLAEWMVAESDNVATDMLLKAIGWERMAASLSEMGLAHTRVERKIFDFAAIDQGRDNRISAADAAAILNRISSQELPRSRWMLEVLRKTRRRDLIQAKLPATLSVAHKTGELSGILHDAALIETPQPYLLVVMTEGADKAVAERFIAGLSRDIFDLISGASPGGDPTPALRNDSK